MSTATETALPSHAPRAWYVVRRSLRRPYRVTLPMVVLFAMVPGYIFIGQWSAGQAVHVPAIALDRMIPLEPVWALVYGALYSVLILAPIFIVREQDHLRRTVWAYLLTWGTAYVWFVAYPTVAPRPPAFSGQGFAAWGLAALYSGDPPYNCFPSLHVAHSFVSALACYRIHRRLGKALVVCAGLVALSTLFTKQHYVADVAGGMLLAGAAYLFFLRSAPREKVPELDRRAAVPLAVLTFGVSLVGMAGFWLLSLWQGMRR